MADEVEQVGSLLVNYDLYYSQACEFKFLNDNCKQA